MITKMKNMNVEDKLFNIKYDNVFKYTKMPVPPTWEEFTRTKKDYLENN